MSNLFGLSSRVSWSLALACAVLAVLSAPGPAWADDPPCTYGAMACSDCNNPAIMDKNLCLSQCGDNCAGAAYCGAGNTSCSVYGTRGDCEPDFDNPCTDPICACRWFTGSGTPRCLCFRK